MREIILDTETTGLDPLTGDRIVEVACLELMNHIPTGRTFQRYLNPERAMSAGAYAVHGLSEDFLAAQPRFADIVDELLRFLGDTRLVIHNADFDMGFLNAELSRAGRPALPRDRALCSLQMARQKFPGAPASLDALCRRFGIDNSARSKHGALLDSELLAEVYLELAGGRQAGLDLAATGGAAGAVQAARIARPPRPHAPSADELAAHAAFLAKLKNPIWTA